MIQIWMFQYDEHLQTLSLPFVASSVSYLVNCKINKKWVGLNIKCKLQSLIAGCCLGNKKIQRLCHNIMKAAKAHQPMPTFLADRRFNWLVNSAQASLCSAIAFCHCHRDDRSLTEACVHDAWQDPKKDTCTYNFKQGFTSSKWRTWELASWSWLKCCEKCELINDLNGKTQRLTLQLWQLRCLSWSWCWSSSLSWCWSLSPSRSWWLSQSRCPPQWSSR